MIYNALKKKNSHSCCLASHIITYQIHLHFSYKSNDQISVPTRHVCISTVACTTHKATGTMSLAPRVGICEVWVSIQGQRYGATGTIWRGNTIRLKQILKEIYLLIYNLQSKDWINTYYMVNVQMKGWHETPRIRTWADICPKLMWMIP